jgi:heme exporter protein D
MIRILTLIPQFMLIAILAVVSGYCEVTLFVDFAETNNLIDKIQMGALAGSLVLAQHTLAQRAGSLFARGHRLAAALVAALVAVLLMISVAASAVFYESRYQASRSEDRLADTGYQLRAQLIADTRASIQQMQKLAEAEAAKGNTWIAGQHQTKAQQIQKSLPALIEQLDQMQTPAASSAGIIAELLASYRWFVWISFGLIADLIPMLLLLLLTVYPQHKHKEEPHSTETRKSLQTDANTELKTPENTAKVPASAPTTLEGLIECLGKMPTWAEVNARGISYRQYKKQRDQLEQRGLVINPGDGSGFRLAGSKC